MNPWNAVKRRLTVKNAKAIKQKAFAGAELVGAGAALMGGSMLLEEIIKTKDPQVFGHDNVYATDNGATLFKVETLAGQDDDKFSNGEIIMYIIFILLALLLLIPLARAVIKIKKMCGQDTSAFSWDRFQKKSDNGQQ